MMETAPHFEQLYLTRESAFGREPDRELLSALASIEPGRLLDLGGGQGRLSLPLAGLGFRVEVVDRSACALGQLAEAARRQRLELTCIGADIGAYRPVPGLQAAVAGLILHLPARHVSTRVARSVGAALNPGGLFYLSLPGYNPQTVEFALELLERAACRAPIVQNHLVTRKERPGLVVPRRNETRAFGFRI